MFTRTLVNRQRMPVRHILVCEDVIQNQAGIAAHFERIFPHEGEVQVSLVSGGEAAAALLGSVPVDLILLDHDMPYGSGPELLRWMAAKGLRVPVVTFSGIPSNNDALMRAGATHRFEKQAVLRGCADTVILELLGLA